VVARQELESRKRGQQVRLDLDDDMPALTLDVTRITQAIAELVSNAIKYAPEQAIIRVACYRADALPEGAPPDTPTPCTVICVTDSGAGVSEDEAERIFQPLYRGKSAGAVEGAGLGLTIAHSITEMHRGKLWVVPSSKKRPGGRFFLALP
jgi:signal transduction histidine kinase